MSGSSRPSRVARRARGIDLEPVHAQRAGRLGRPRLEAPHHGMDPRDQLAQAVRLDHVVVGAELEPDDAVDLLAAGA